MKNSGLRLQALFVAALAWVVAMAPVATPAPAVLGKSFDQILPAGTTIFVSVRSVSDLSKKFESEPYKSLREDPEIKKWLESLAAQMTEEWNKGENDVKVSPQEVWDAVEGEMAFFLGEIDMKAENPEPKSGGLLVDSGSKSEEFGKLFSRMIKGMQDKDYNATTEKHGEVTITILDKKIPDENDRMANRACAAQAGSVFMMVSDLDAAKSIIDGLAGDPKAPLAGSESYKQIRDRVGKGEFFAYANTGFLKDAVNLMAGDIPEEMKETVEKAVKELGVTSVKGAGFGLSLNNEGVRADGFVSLDGYKGVTKILSKNRELTIKGVPKDASSAGVGHLDMDEAGKVVDTLLKLVGDALAAQGGGGDPKEMIKQFLGIDLKEDLVDPLGNEVRWFNRYSKPYTENSAEFVALWKLKNGKKFQETLNTLVERIAGFTGQDVESEEVQGTKVYKLKMDPQPQEFGVAIKGEMLLYGNLKGVREALKAEAADDSWKDREEIRPLLSRLPKLGIFGMVMSSEDIEYFTTLAREGKLAGLGKLPIEQAGEAEKALNKGTKDLPSPETFKKYIEGGVVYATAEDSGISLVGLFLLKNRTK